jgi:DnaJ-class molecular chaperone
MNPYLVLGVARDADDARMRQAYLDAVKAAPPETHPVRFQEISSAYEKIKDESSRCRHELFDTECPGDSPLDAMLRHVRLTLRSRPPAHDQMKEFLRACAKP